MRDNCVNHWYLKSTRQRCHLKNNSRNAISRYQFCDSNETRPSILFSLGFGACFDWNNILRDLNGLKLAASWDYSFSFHPSVNEHGLTSQSSRTVKNFKYRARIFTGSAWSFIPIHISGASRRVQVEQNDPILQFCSWPFCKVENQCSLSVLHTIGSRYKLLMITWVVLYGWDLSGAILMVLNRPPNLQNMTTKAPLRTAQSPSYAVSLSVVPSHSPVVVRRAMKIQADDEQVLVLKALNT